MISRGMIAGMIAVFLLSSPGFAQEEQQPSAQTETGQAMGRSESSELATIAEVIDGRTLRLTNGQDVRLIGVDAPVIVIPEGVDPALYDPPFEMLQEARKWGDDLLKVSKMGQEAKEFVKNLGVVKGRHIRLEFDRLKKDEYGRMLAYAYIETCYPDCPMTPMGFPYYKQSDDGLNEVFLNATIIKSGYATSMIIPPNVKYAALFDALYKQAREQRRGLWQDALITESQALSAFKKHWQEILPGLDEPRKSLAAALTHKVTDNLLFARLQLCARSYERVSGTLTDQEKEKLILHGSITGLQREDDCWEIGSGGGIGNEIAATLSPDRDELMLLWIVPEG